MKRLLRYVLCTFLVTLSFLFVSCGKTGYEASITKVKKGMTEEQVVKIMGPYEAMDQENNLYKILYWFEGADSMEEAQELSVKGSHVKYYCVIVITTDYIVYSVQNKDDIFSGYWGVK